MATFRYPQSLFPILLVSVVWASAASSVALSLGDVDGSGTVDAVDVRLVIRANCDVEMRSTCSTVMPRAPVFFLRFPCLSVVRSARTKAATSGFASRISEIISHCRLAETRTGENENVFCLSEMMRVFAPFTVAVSGVTW